MGNNPPFYIGQKVVAIKNSRPGFLFVYKVGDKKTVNHVKQEMNGLWVMATEDSDDWYLDCRNFAPIEPLYNDVTAELAGKAITEEVPDLIKPLIHKS